MLPVPSERYVPVVQSQLDEDLDPHPCEEDEEFFKSRPNAEEMEDAISKFLDAMPTVESKRDAMPTVESEKCHPATR